MGFLENVCYQEGNVQWSRSSLPSISVPDYDSPALRRSQQPPG